MILSRDVRRPFIPTMRCWLTRAQSRRQFSRGCWLWDSGSKCASHRDGGEAGWANGVRVRIDLADTKLLDRLVVSGQVPRRPCQRRTR
jgi:hypothetical protein